MLSERDLSGRGQKRTNRGARSPDLHDGPFRSRRKSTRLSGDSNEHPSVEIRLARGGTASGGSGRDNDRINPGGTERLEQRAIRFAPGFGRSKRDGDGDPGANPGRRGPV